jgi:hypothetical protein
LAAGVIGGVSMGCTPEDLYRATGNKETERKLPVRLSPSSPPFPAVCPEPVLANHRLFVPNLSWQIVEAQKQKRRLFSLCTAAGIACGGRDILESFTGAGVRNRKRVSVRRFHTKNDHFTKTGSGQT